MKKILNPNKHYQTKNARGVMHPISEIGRKFIEFSITVQPVIEMGCAFGNIAIAALEAGTNSLIACDMEQQHLDFLRNQIDTSINKLITKQGIFPQGFDFSENSVSAIHASHILEYLNGEDIDVGLEKFHRWLKPGGKLFILCYTVHILELANQKFREEYQRRIDNKIKWPGYLEDFNKYSMMPDNSEPEYGSSAFPTALHFYDLPILKQALEAQGFIIEFAEYLDGKENGAVKDTWHDGREYVGIVALKPDKISLIGTTI